MARRSRNPVDSWLGWLALYAPPVLAIIAGLVALATPADADTGIPPLGYRLESVLADELEEVWGVQADRYAAVSGAQIHQESLWRPKAESPNAQGLTQFTPATSKWIAEKFRVELWPADPWDPYWSIRAMVIYDDWIHRRIWDPASECDAWAMTLSAYNGGLGWVNRDRQLCRLEAEAGGDCRDGRWFNHVEHYSQRADWAFKENRGYPRRILLKLTPAYIRAGFSGDHLCREVRP